MKKCAVSVAGHRRGEQRPPGAPALVAPRGQPPARPGRRHEHGDHHDGQHRGDELRQPRRQRGRREHRRQQSPPRVSQPLRRAGPADLAQDGDLIDGGRKSEDERRDGEKQGGNRQAPRDVAVRGAPRVERPGQRSPPQPGRLPQARARRRSRRRSRRRRRRRGRRSGPRARPLRSARGSCRHGTRRRCPCRSARARCVDRENTAGGARAQTLS